MRLSAARVKIVPSAKVTDSFPPSVMSTSFW